MQLEGKVALVTGAGSGIGEAAARAYAREGAAVAVLDIRREPANEVASRIRNEGGRAEAYVVDVGNEDNICEAVRSTVETYGRLDVVFANAGINGVHTPIEEMTLAEWNKTMDTNLTGTFLTVKHSIPHLRTAGGGAVVITASVNGNKLFSLPGYSCYSTSKAGQVAFAKMAAAECARWGIRVNAILPGGVSTNIMDRTFPRNLEGVTYDIRMPKPWPPLTGHPATPDEVAELVLFLSTNASRNITGGEFLIDAGGTLLRG